MQTQREQQSAIVISKFDSYIELLLKKAAIESDDRNKNELINFVSSVMYMNDMLISNWFNFDFIKEASDLLDYGDQKQKPFICHLLYITRSYLSDEDCDLNLLRLCIQKALQNSTTQSESAPIINTKIIGYRTIPAEEITKLLDSVVFLIFMSILLNFHSTSVMSVTDLLLNNNPKVS